MKSKFKTWVSTISILGLMLTSIVVFATDHVGGGDWDHYLTADKNVSRYLHKSLKHSASTGYRKWLTGSETVTHRDIAGPGIVAHSESDRVGVWATNRAWWNNDCI